MTWVIYSLIAAIATAVIGILDKMVLAKWMTKPTGSFFVFSVIETASGVIALALLGWPRLNGGQMSIALLSGAAFAAASLCYFEAVKVEEISRVGPLFSLSPIFVAVFAAVFLGEVFTVRQYLGVLLLTGGAFLLSLKSLRDWRFGRGLWWMLLGVGLISAGAVASKYLLDTSRPWTVFAYTKLGTIIIALPLLVPGYRSLAESVRGSGPRVLVYSGLSEGLTSITTIFFLLAASTGYITLVNALIGTQPFFLLFLTVLLSAYWPKILQEEISRRLILRKAVAIAGIFAGIWLVTAA